MNTTANANRQYFFIKKYPNIAKQKQNDVSVTSESAQAIRGGQKWLKGSSYPHTQSQVQAEPAWLTEFLSRLPQTLQFLFSTAFLLPI